jgi:hypothetical protein
MAKRIVSDKKMIQESIDDLKAKAEKLQRDGKISEAIMVLGEIEKAMNRKAAVSVDSNTPAEQFVLDAIDRVKQYHKENGEDYNGVVPNWNQDALKGTSINFVLFKKFGLSKDQRIELTANMVNAGKIEVGQFSYTNKRGERKGAHRLYIAGEMPESTGVKNIDSLSVEDILA